MEELWTPWRMAYIVGTKHSDECIFCPKPGPSRLDQQIVHRDRLTFTLLNLYPYTMGHLMVVPYRHVPRFGLLEPAERAELASGLRRAEQILRDVLGAEYFHAGINLGRAAGAGVDGHLHVHLVPRGLPPACGGLETEIRTETLPLSVDEVWSRLAPLFAASA